MEIRLAGMVNDSIVDGPGFRLAIFTQGCPHNCPGCHNPETHDFEGGKLYDINKVIEAFQENILLDGITFSGGDPFCQSDKCAVIAKAAKESGLNVWAYSGWTFEALMEKAKTETAVRDFLSYVDVLVDGPFILAQRTLELRFRGSKNQRLIDVPASLLKGEAVEKTE